MVSRRDFTAQTIVPFASSVRPQKPCSKPSLMAALDWCRNIESMTPHDLNNLCALVKSDYETNRITATEAFTALRAPYCLWAKQQPKGQEHHLRVLSLIAEMVCCSIRDIDERHEKGFVANATSIGSMKPCDLLASVVHDLELAMTRTMASSVKEAKSNCSKSTLSMVVSTVTGNCRATISQPFLAKVLELYPDFRIPRTRCLHREDALAARERQRDRHNGRGHRVLHHH